MLSFRLGVEQDSLFPVVIEDVLIVCVGLVECCIGGLRAPVEGHGAVSLLGVRTSVEPTVSSLTDRSDEPAVSQLFQLGLVATRINRCRVDVPCCTGSRWSC